MAAVKYHINPKTGNPGVCGAKRSCPFGDMEKEHYPTKWQAMKAFEEGQGAQVAPAAKKPLKLPPLPTVKGTNWEQGQDITYLTTGERVPSDFTPSVKAITLESLKKAGIEVKNSTSPTGGVYTYSNGEREVVVLGDYPNLGEVITYSDNTSETWVRLQEKGTPASLAPPTPKPRAKRVPRGNPYPVTPNPEVQVEVKPRKPSAGNGWSSSYKVMTVGGHHARPLTRDSRVSKTRLYTTSPSEEAISKEAGVKRDSLQFTRRGDNPAMDEAWDKWNRATVRLMKKEALRTLAEVGHPEAKVSFSRKAGCGCGCSPGFVVDRMLSFEGERIESLSQSGKWEERNS